ncbi:hypothetical protein QUF75_08655 [Desulfococcaceae bacterium HSG7]|nr:hypothetical protein [Desulfococcaceae bacterium HSG9]MDM8554784.1 hypothetical protein [Desulfococcaceae bacterium HSG7]
MPIARKIVAVALFLTLFACQSKHDINVEPVEIKPIHITIDVNVRIEKALDDFFSDIDQEEKKIETQKNINGSNVE